MDFQLQPGNSSLNVDTGVEGNGEEARVYPGRGAGGKLRVNRRGSGKKAKPYDRPASGRHATAGGISAPSAALSSSSSSSSSIASRLVGSASRFISSSASYLFPSLFGRKTFALTYGNLAPVQDVIAEEQDEQEDLETPTKEDNDEGQNRKDTLESEQGRALVEISARLEKKELDLAQVEDMLKHKTWSRDQVNRLTELLKNRMIEPISRTEEAAGQASRVAINAIVTPMHSVEECTATPISEAQRWREELKRARTDCMPVEVARAYMGERTSLQSRLSLSVRGTPHQMDRVAELQPPPGLGLTGDRYRQFPVLRSSTRSPAHYVPKRSSFLEEDWMSVGPVRRTRQKTFHMMNASPYARGTPAGEIVSSRTYTSPPVQSSQTARKILDTLEMLSPSPKGKYLCEGSSSKTGTPDIFRSQGRNNTQTADAFKFSGLRERSTSNGKLEFGSLAKSPSNFLPWTVGNVKESNFEDKSRVDRVPSVSEAGLSSVLSGVSPKVSGTSMTLASATTVSVHSSAAALATFGSPMCASPPTDAVHSQLPAASVSIQPENKPLLAFSLPSSTAEHWYNRSREPVETSFSVPVSSTSPSFPDAAPSLISYAREQGEKRVAYDGEPGGLANPLEEPTNDRPFQFEFPSTGSPFSFKMGNNSSQSAVMGAQSAEGQGFAFKAPSESLSSFSLAATSMSGMPSFGSTTIAAVSEPLVSFVKPSSVGQSLGASSMTKQSLTIVAPFTFSPPPAPASCSTPTFSFGSNANTSLTSSFSAGQSSAANLKMIKSEAISTSKSGDVSLPPVFSFTSPSGGPKLPTFGSNDTSLPVPTFKFRSGASSFSTSSLTFGAQTASLASSGPLFGSNNQTSSSKSPEQLFGSGAVLGPLPTAFTFGGQTGSSMSPEQLFGSGSGAGSGPVSNSFTFGGQTGSSFSFGSGAGSSSLMFGGQTGSSPSAALFGSKAGSTPSPFPAEVTKAPSQGGREFSAGLAPGAGDSDKSGRKFVKAKRRK